MKKILFLLFILPGMSSISAGEPLKIIGRPVGKVNFKNIGVICDFFNKYLTDK